MSYHKPTLHPRNRHREPYDFINLFLNYPELSQFEKPNVRGETSIDFTNPDAMVVFNRILLKKYYQIDYWEIPPNYLCPPIAGRADYIHYVADLLGIQLDRKQPPDVSKKVLDIGVGANCIYPILGILEYGWSFVGTDIDKTALENASQIAEKNPALKGKIELRNQTDSKSVFKGIIRKGEYFDLTVCNPPFHSSFEESQAKALRKFNTLTLRKNSKSGLNLSGQSNELWCEGGEIQFLRNMINESREFSESVSWFTTLVSKKANLESVYTTLESVKATEVKTIQMAQGNKESRIVAWRG